MRNDSRLVNYLLAQDCPLSIGFNYVLGSLPADVGYRRAKPGTRG